jgi:hypothetical protein
MMHLNILSNAVKYRTAVRLTARMAPGDVRTLVKTPARRAEPARRRSLKPFHRGGGIAGGGPVARAVDHPGARRMGATLVSAPSVQGARFCLTLPAWAWSGSWRQRQPPCALVARPRILVVDDIASNRQVAATYPPVRRTSERTVARRPTTVQPLRFCWI